MDNTPTQNSPDKYRWFTDPANAIPELRQEIFNTDFVSPDEDPFERALRQRKQAEIQAGLRIPTFISGQFGTTEETSTTREVAAAGLERTMEAAPTAGWGERNAQALRERNREFTTGKYRDFAPASEVERLQDGDWSDYFQTLLDALPFAGESTEQATAMIDSLLKQEQVNYTHEEKLKELDRITAKDPEIKELAAAYGIDLVSLALSSRNKFQLNFAIQQKIKEGLQNKRYETYDNAELGWFTRARWNAAEMVQDPYFVRDMIVTTAATAGLGTIQLGAARLGAAGVQAGTRAAQLAHKALRFTGPMVGFVEGPSFVALRTFAPKLGTVGARALAIGLEGAAAGGINAYRTQEETHAVQSLLFNDKNGIPFNPRYSEILEASLIGSGLSILALGTLRTVLGSIGDIPTMYKVKSAGGTFNDMLRAYGREWSSSLDNWATSPQGLTVWGNQLSGGRGIYFGDMLDRMARREIDGRNFTNVLANGRRVWAAADPVVASRLNLDIDRAMPIIEKFEEVTGIAGEAAMKGEAGGEVAAVFKSLIDIENYSKKGITQESVVALIDEIGARLKGEELAPTPVVGAMRNLAALDKYDYALVGRAVGRGLNALSLSSQLEARGISFNDVFKETRAVTGKYDLDILDDLDWTNTVTSAQYLHGQIDSAIAAVTFGKLFDFDPRSLSVYDIPVDEALSIKQGILDSLVEGDEFTVLAGSGGVHVNKKTGEVRRLFTSNELEGDRLVITAQTRDGKKVRLSELKGDDVVSAEKISLEVNKLHEQVRALFSEESMKRMADDARRASTDPEVDSLLEQVRTAWDKGQEVSPKLLQRLFNLTTQQAFVGHAVVKALGLGPMETTLRFAKGHAGKAGIAKDSRAEISFFTTAGANAALIRAVGSTDLGSIIHEMGHFSFQTLFGKGLYDPAVLRTIGITEKMERAFLEWAGVDFSKPDVEAQIASVSVQEKVANGWNAYFRNVLENKPSKGSSAVKRLFNKVGDYLGDVGATLKSSEAEEASIKMTAEAEEVFDLLLKRAEANIDDIYSAAYDGVFKTLSPELRDQVGIHVLGEAKYNDWKAKNELREAAIKTKIEKTISGGSVKPMTPEEIGLTLDGAVGRSVARRRIREWLPSLKRLDGETDDAFNTRVRETVAKIAERITAEGRDVRKLIDEGKLEAAGDLARHNKVDVTPNRLNAISTEALIDFVTSGDEVMFRPHAVDDIGIKINPDGSLDIVVRRRGIELTKAVAQVELARRNDELKLRAEEKAAKEAKKVAKAEARAKEKEAKAKAAAEKKAKKELERAAAKAKKEEEKAKKKAAREAKKAEEEAKKAKTKEEREKILEENRKKREEAAAERKKKQEEAAAEVERKRREELAAAEAARDAEVAEATRLAAAETASEVRAEMELESSGSRAAEDDSIDTEVTTEVTEQSLVTREGIVINDPTPAEAVAAVTVHVQQESVAAVERKVDQIVEAETPEEMVDAVTSPIEPVVVPQAISVEPQVTVRRIARRKLSEEAASRTENAARARSRVSESDTNLVDTLVDTAFISRAALNNVLKLINDNAENPTLSTEYLAAVMSLKSISIAEGIKGVTPLSEADTIAFNKLLADIENLNVSGSRAVILEKLQQGLASVDDAVKEWGEANRAKLELFERGHRFQREADSIKTFRESNDFVRMRAKDYNVAKIAQKYGKATENQLAIITTFEAHLKRVQLGPVVTVKDVEKAVVSRKRQPQIAKISDAEIMQRSAERVLNNSEAKALLNSKANTSLLIDLVTPFTDKTTKDYKLSVIFLHADIENKDKMVLFDELVKQKPDEFEKTFENARTALTKNFGNIETIDILLKAEMQLRKGHDILVDNASARRIADIFNDEKMNVMFAEKAEAVIIQHPTVQKIMTARSLDSERFISIVTEKLRDKEIIKLLLDRELNDAARNNIDSPFKGFNVDMYLAYLLEAVEKKKPLPDTFVRFVRSIATKVERKEVMGSGPNRFESSAVKIDAVSERGTKFDVVDRRVGSIEEALGLNAYFEYQQFVSGLMFENMRKAGRTDLAEFFTERQALAELERETKTIYGEAVNKINELRKSAGKPEYSKQQFDALNSELGEIIDTVISEVYLKDPAFGDALTESGMLTSRTANEKTARRKRLIEKGVEHLNEDGEVVAVETADTVTVYQQKMDPISRDELLELERDLTLLDLDNDSTTSIAGSIVLHKLESSNSQLLTSLYEGTIANAADALMLMMKDLEGSKNAQIQKAIISQLLKTNKADLKNIWVFSGFNPQDSSTLGQYFYGNHNGLLVNVTNLLGQTFHRQDRLIPQVHETLLHEVLHGVTSARMAKVYTDNIGLYEYTNYEASVSLIKALANKPRLTKQESIVNDLAKLYVEYVDQLIRSMVVAPSREEFFKKIETAEVAAQNNLYHVYNLDEFIANPLTSKLYMSQLLDQFSTTGFKDKIEEISREVYSLVSRFNDEFIGVDKTESSYLYKLSALTERLARTRRGKTQAESLSDPSTLYLGSTTLRPYRFDVETNKLMIPQDEFLSTWKDISSTKFDILDEFDEVASKARADLRSAKGRMLDTLHTYQQKRAESDLRAKIETEGMAGKDVSDMEQRLEDLILSADERQRILRGMGLHEELEPRDIEALTNIINGNSAFYTPDVAKTMEFIRKLNVAKTATKVDRPMQYRDMNNEERTVFLLETMLPKVEAAIGTRNQTGGVFSLFTDSVVGKKANQFIGGAVEYSKTADSDSAFLQFISKFFDPMMDLRDGELNLAFNMPSIDKLNAEINGLYQKSGLATAYEKVKEVAGDQESLDYINNTAWDYLARKADLPETVRFRNEIIAVIDAVNNMNKETHDLLVKYGGQRSAATTAEEYGTVRRAGARAYRNPKEFANALYKHMLERSKAAHANGEISALAAEALGWINYKRSDTNDEILTVSVPKESPLAKLFKETDKEISWKEAKAIFKNGVEKLTKEESDKLFKALETSADYKDSYKKAHAGRDASYSVIRQAAEIARNRYMRFGDVGDTKSLKPKSESVGGGRNYAEERIITHDELAQNRELASFFDKNIMRLTEDMLRSQATEAMSTKMITDFFGGNVRITVLDMIEIFRNAGEGVRRGDVDPIALAETNRGYDRVKLVWEEFIGKLPTGTDSMDPYYRDALLNSRYTVLLAGGVRAALSSVPELSRAILASDHHRSKFAQLFPNLLLAFRYSRGTNRERLNQMASAYHWIRNMSAETILARTEALPDNPFNGVSFGGRRGWFSTWTNNWNAIRGMNEVENSKFRKLLNYLGYPASMAGAPLAWINMVTTSIHVHNAQMNLTKNSKNFLRLVELMDGRTITNTAEFNRLADEAGLTSKEALDLSSSGILNPERVKILVDMANDPTTKVDEMLDVSRMYKWAREQTKYSVESVDAAILALGQYVGMTARHTNTEPTLLDKRVNNSVYSKALSVFMQFLLSHSIQEIGRRRRYSTVNYSKHILGLMMMEAGVYAMGRMYKGEEPYGEDDTETFIRIATGMPMLGSYQYLAALLRQASFAVYNEYNKEDKFEEQLRIPGLIDAPADTAPKRVLNGVTWGGSILMDLLKEGS